jgi:hypothetical protein
MTNFDREVRALCEVLQLKNLVSRDELKAELESEHKGELKSDHLDVLFAVGSAKILQSVTRILLRKRLIFSEELDLALNQIH